MSQHRWRRLAAVILAALAAGSAPAVADSGEALHQLFAEHHAWRLREFPRWAMERGDYSQADKLDDQSLTAIERRFADLARFLERLRKIERAQLTPADALYFDLFELELSQAIEGRRFREFLAPIGGRYGPHQEIPQLHERVRFRSRGDYDNYLTRLEQVPRQIDQIIERLKLGISEARTPPRVTLAGVPDQFKALQRGGLDALAEPLTYVTADLSDEARAELRQRFETRSLPAVRDALRKLGDFIENTYLGRCRDGIAATDWPEGAEYYAYQLRTMTTTELTADQIHRIGLDEVARIRGEMMQVIARTDFASRVPDSAKLAGDELFARFIQYLRSDARFYYASGEELLAGYRDVCKRIDAELPRVFRVLPRLPYGVRPIPQFMAPAQTTAYYQRGDLRNGQPGVFYANTYALDQRPKYEMMALALHEAVPGHHFQIAIAQEMENVPEFRRDAWFHAFGEGWALYAERLGLEVGLYGDPYDDFGRLLYEMWRSCRLVVDTGMHAKGWPRERAIRFMLDNTALSELNIRNEVDRYIAWPGQACAYKLGELKIRELRARAEKRLGASFDLREFHEMILGAGSLPLSVLDRRVNTWLDAQSPPK